jgi:hypothetical protein
VKGVKLHVFNLNLTHRLYFLKNYYLPNHILAAEICFFLRTRPFRLFAPLWGRGKRRAEERVIAT